MSNVYDRTAFEDAILYSDDDYEPYGYATPQLEIGTDTPNGSRFEPYKREIEAAILKRLESYCGC